MTDSTRLKSIIVIKCTTSLHFVQILYACPERLYTRGKSSVLTVKIYIIDKIILTLKIMIINIFIK